MHMRFMLFVLHVKEFVIGTNKCKRVSGFFVPLWLKDGHARDWFKLLRICLAIMALFFVFVFPLLPDLRWGRKTDDSET